MALTQGDLNQIKNWLKNNIDVVRQFIKDNELLERQQNKVQRQADLDIALAWYNTLGIDIQGALTRDEALANYRQIESLLETETDNFRLFILRGKLDEANEKYKQVKAVNPNS